MKTNKCPSRAQFWSACLGNLFEHYDTALFGFLSVFLAPLIFPDQEPTIALILTYAMIPLGMLVRPLGSFVFGYIGDQYGREQALFLTLGGMAMVSGVIAFTPTYYQVGILSPIIFCLGRILQNFFSAGELIGGAIFLLENVPEKKRDFLSSLYSSSTIGGILLASAGVSLVIYYGVIDQGWRVLYGLGCVTALFGCIIRRRSHSEFSIQAKPKFSQTFSGMGKVFWEHRKPLLSIAVCSGFSYANYLVSLVLLNGYIPLVSSLTKEQMMGVNTGLLIFDFATLPLFGWLASKFSREKVMLTASLGVIFFAVPLFALLKDASLITVIAVRTVFVLLGVTFAAPFHAWSQQLVPPAHRYLIVAFGYSLGTQVFGGPTAALSLWFFQTTGIITSPCWYWMLLALASTSVIIYQVLQSPHYRPVVNSDLLCPEKIL